MRVQIDRLCVTLTAIGFAGHGVNGLAHVARVTSSVLSLAPQTTITSHLAKITTPPSARDLHKRQATGGLSGTFMFAPDSVCGYITGDIEAPWSCGSKSTCAFATESGGMVACCNSANCAAAVTGCIDESTIKAGGCNSACSADDLILKCTDTNSFCQTFTFSGGILDYGCADYSYSSLQPAEFAPSGSPSVVFSTKVIGFGFVTNADDGPGGSSTKTESTSSGASSTASTEPTAAATPAPIGPIVGGAVGGAVALILLALGGFLLWRRRSKKDEAAQHEKQMLNQQQYQYPQQQPFIPAHNSGNSYYQPPTTPGTYNSELPTEHNSHYKSASLQPDYTGRPVSEMPGSYNQPDQGTPMVSPGTTQIGQHTGAQAPQRPAAEMP